MNINEVLTRICNKTIEEKYTIPDVNFDFFGYAEGKGMFVKDYYIEVAEKYKCIDMMYDFFDWQNGVGFYGLIEAGKKLGTDTYFDFVKEWVEYHIKKGLPPETINTTAPFLSVAEIYSRTKDKKYYDLCEERARYIMTDAPRTDDGALEHTVIGVEQKFKSQIWADTLFMGALFLAKWGAVTGNTEYIKEAANQLVLHYRFLTDKATGLFFHGYNAADKTNMSAVRWGRANAWGIMASNLILEYIPDEFKEKQIIKDNLVAHLRAVAACQHEDGSFNTVLNMEDTYKETTIVCGFYYAAVHARVRGYIGNELKTQEEKALSYILTQVSDDGTVENTSGGTPLMRDVEEYNKIPCVMSYYGQGMAIMALTESLQK